MSERNTDAPRVEQQARSRGESPWRLRRSMDVLAKLGTGKLDVTGREHLAEIPENRPVVIAVTHTDDLSIPLATKALGGDFDLRIADISGHRHLKQDPYTFPGLLIAGRDNFIPVDYGKEEGAWKASLFNPENFEPMAEALKSGQTVLIAAHNPSREHALTESPGYGAIFLAQKTGAAILPVAVDLKAKENVGMSGLRAFLATFKNRPDASVTIGSPMYLDTVDVSVMSEVINKRRSKEEVTPDEREKFASAKSKVQEQAGNLMRNLARMLPAEKRGKWGEQPQQTTESSTTA